MNVHCRTWVKGKKVTQGKVLLKVMSKMQKIKQVHCTSTFQALVWVASTRISFVKLKGKRKEDTLSFVGGTGRTHNKGYGYRKDWRIGVNNPVYFLQRQERSICTSSLDLKDSIKVLPEGSCSGVLLLGISWTRLDSPYWPQKWPCPLILLRRLGCELRVPPGYSGTSTFPLPLYPPMEKFIYLLYF